MTQCLSVYINLLSAHVIMCALQRDDINPDVTITFDNGAPTNVTFIKLYYGNLVKTAVKIRLCNCHENRWHDLPCTIAGQRFSYEPVISFYRRSPKGKCTRNDRLESHRV